MVATYSGDSASSAASSQHSAEEPAKATPHGMEKGPEEGTLWSWLVVAGSFLNHFTVLGTQYSMGVFLPSLLEEFFGTTGAGDVDGAAAIALTFSVASALMLLLGAATGRLCDAIGFRIVLWTAGVCVALGLLLSSFATELWHFGLAYSLLAGIGFAGVLVPSLAVVTKWFRMRTGLAVGLAVSGSGLGTLAFAPISQVLIDNLGWRGALQILAGLNFVCVLIAGALFRLPSDLVGTTVGIRKFNWRTLFMFSLFKDLVFTFLYLAGLLLSYGYFVPFVFLVKFALANGIEAADAALLVSIIGGASTVGRVLIGALADKVGRLRMMQVCMVCYWISMTVWPWLTTFEWLVAFSVVFGLFAGGYISMLPAVLAQYFPAPIIATVTGTLYSGSALGTLIGGPVTGAIIEAQDGDFTVAFLVGGITAFLALPLLFALPWTVRRRDRIRAAKAKDEGGDKNKDKGSVVYAESGASETTESGYDSESAESSS